MSQEPSNNDLSNETHDTRHQYHSANSDKYARMGFSGLKMNKKRNNFKEMQKANERLQQKRSLQNQKLQQERAQRREEAAQREFAITSKDQIRKERKSAEKHNKRQEKLKEKAIRRSLQAEEERELSQETAAKQIKHR